MYEIEISRHFSGAHKLVGYPGDCKKLHGHNWEVTAVLYADKLDEVGIAIDFKILKKELDAILDRFDHAYLNELPEFAAINPTSENLSRLIYQALSAKLNSETVTVHKIKVAESSGSSANYFEV